jgi:hypothetical protein
LFFQAVEQRVQWKPGIPLPPIGLFGLPDDPGILFEDAYIAGARIHRDSWGGPSKNER